VSALLEVEGLWKSYGDKVVLRDVDLLVRPHDVVTERLADAVEPEKLVHRWAPAPW
jgi:hypothetical protein